MKMHDWLCTYSRYTVAAIFVFMFFTAATAGAEFVISGYLGKADTLDADVTLRQREGTDLTFYDVSWNDDSFEDPLYFGLRLQHWFENARNWGVGIDFTHAKMLAGLNETVRVTGSRSGLPVSSDERLSDTFSRFEFTDGHNLLTLNGFYRWFPKGIRDNTVLGRLQPYVGLGLGIAYPHVEVETMGSTTSEYQIVGPAAQGVAGVNFDVYKGLSLFTELKLTYADMDADLQSGGSIEVEPWTHHIAFGLSYGF